MPDIFALYVNYRLLCYLRKISNNIIGCINLKFSETFHRQRSLSLNVCYIYRCQVFFRRSHRNSSVLCNYILQPCYIAMQLTNRYIVDRRETDSVHSRTTPLYSVVAQLGGVYTCSIFIRFDFDKIEAKSDPICIFRFLS